MARLPSDPGLSSKFFMLQLNTYSAVRRDSAGFDFVEMG